MDDVRAPVVAPSLYDADEYAWYSEQIAALREGRLGDVDREHLVEFLEDVARRETREIESRWMVLIEHVLKTLHQPERLSRSWITTIIREQNNLRLIFEGSAVLARSGPELLRRAYPKAARAAEAAIGLPRGSIPRDCTWSAEELLEFEPPPPFKAATRRRALTPRPATPPTPD